ncbi:tail fiber protein [Acinetobacter phage Petty]|uniref:Tail fiber protein n=1 Tax=Acinetobacter phage Petty TaxID=1406779 RepID=U5PW98_9CAUD|nr:tail fiber protein [Acinetobacter phage Petty]AGY48011.1 tail fiber protein [Acinetobacter phage Petty]
MAYVEKEMNLKRSFVEYKVTQPTTNFALPFEFVEAEQNLRVRLNGIDIEDLGYSFLVTNNITVQVTPAIPHGTLSISRETDIDKNLYKFTAGALFEARTMDKNFEQIRHSQQEVRDGFEKLSDATYTIIDTLQDVGQAAQDAADAAEQAAQAANDAAAQVNDKVSQVEIDYIHENGAALPHKDGIDYEENAVVVKGGVLQQWKGGAWVNVGEQEVKKYLLVAGVDESELDDDYNYLMQRLAQIAVDKGWDASFVVDGNINQHERNTGVKSLNQLRLTKPSKKGDRVFLASVNEAQNEGGGEFIATQKAGLVDDGGLVIASPDPMLFWVRVHYDTVTPEMFGAVGDNTADDAIPLQKTMSCGRAIEFDKGRKYRSSKPIEMFTGQKIKGNGAKITKYTASKTGITGRTDPSGNPYDYDQDCAVVFGAWYGWYSYIDIENLTIQKEAVLGADVGKVFFAPYISMSSLKSVVVKGGEYGFYGEDLWMLNWTRCEAYSKCGFYVGTGTSNQFNTCWSKETKEGYSAFRLHNLTYSSLINCCAEHVGEDGAPAEAAYHITNSDLTMIGCGIENIHAYNLIRIGYSWVTIENPSFIYGINNKYRHGTYTGLIDVSSSDSVVTLRGGHITATNSGTFADAVRVGGGTFNYETPLWNNVGFPDDSSGFKIRISNYAAIMNLTGFDGRKYTFNGRSKKWDIHTKAKFLNGLQANLLGTTHLNNIRKDFYIGTQNKGNNGSVANGYPFDGFGGTVLNFSDEDAAQYSNTAQLALSAVSNRVFFRRAAYEQALGSWFEFRTSANTTVDANGFVKNASPIVKLFADRIELNDDAEKQNIEFEKLGVGDYLIKGSSGFSDNGWYIETPKDANGNVLFSVIYATLENGDISVKTYQKKFDLETASIVADLEQPVDITVGRWIDLRLNEVSAN